MGRTARRRRAVALLATTAVAGLAGCGGERAAPDRPDTGWTVHRDTRHGVTVRFPSSWQRSRVSLTPHLVSPREVLSLGTFALRRGGPSSCAHQPVGALRAAGKSDIFISLQERGSTKPLFPRRRPFVLGAADRSEAIACVGRSVRWRSYWVQFSDAGRSFYLLAVVGDRASRARRSQLRAVLASLRFTPSTVHHAPMASPDHERRA